MSRTIIQTSSHRSVWDDLVKDVLGRDVANAGVPSVLTLASLAAVPLFATGVGYLNETRRAEDREMPPAIRLAMGAAIVAMGDQPEPVRIQRRITDFGEGNALENFIKGRVKTSYTEELEQWATGEMSVGELSSQLLGAFGLALLATQLRR